MKRYTLLLTLIMSLLLLTRLNSFADSSDEVTPTGFGVSFGAWIKPNFSGITKAGGGGTEISLNNQLGLPSQTMLVPSFYYRWDHGQILNITYTQYDQTVTQNLSAPQTFQGINFAAGAPATTHAKLQWGDITYELPIAYDKFPPKNFYLNALVDIEALRGTFTMTNAAGIVGAHSPITAPGLLLGLHAKYRLFENTSFEAKAAGMRFGFQDALSWDYNFEAGVNQTFFDMFTITGKYRYFTFYNRDSEDNRFGFRIYGPEVDAGFHF